MASRSRLAAGALLSLLFLAPLGLAQDRPTPLPALKRQRDHCRDAHHDVVVRISLLEQERRKLTRELSEVTGRVRALQREPTGVLRDRQLKATRREQNGTSRKLAAVKVRLRAEEDARKVRRMRLIQASWAYVARLLETADRAWRIHRRKQAREHTDMALAELKRLEDLEALEDAPEEDYTPTPIDPEAPTAELREFRDLFEALTEALTEQVRELEPTERMLKLRVRHLDRLVQYAYAVPTLDERLKRAQKDLERISDLRRGAEERAARYRKHVDDIDKLITARSRAQQGRERRNGR